MKHSLIAHGLFGEATTSGTLDLATRALYRFLLSSATIRQPCCAQLCQGKTAVRGSFRRYTTLQPPLARGQSPSYLQDKVYDENIRSRFINFVDENGKFHPSMRVHEVLRNLDRNSQHLIAVTPDNPHTNQPPVCKIFSKLALQQAEQAQLKKANRIDSSKQVEMHWTIDAADLSHKLNSMVEFLEEGRRVEVLIKPKKRSRKATDEEAAAVFEKVKDTAMSVEGTQEIKEREGKLGAMVTLVFESPQKQSEKDKLAKMKKESSEKVLEKRKKLENKDFEKKVLEKQRKFELKRLEKANRERAPPFVARRVFSSAEQTRHSPTWSPY